ncbi:MAG: pimeloyl-CoA dehydrogenase [Mesonia sp.]|uniref:Quercetin 2,3-dioxygenase n=2 Tax=Flavobacteriaceae TaxID=49546 RepID=A0AC61YDW5_9FLAO|nr:pimeloyl-CoA dehydrogenase [Mesonia sp.]MAQ41752.1 pimeloyl-CoA dehydrogenase [Mesonia sp.]MBJ98830.1 pimeloyl-CoA dehydrogenase [Flavobacteriaceae bacterium]VVV02428.1 Quercetin 2,3-dioxygenase [Mesonia oceanica]|tara:strand:+ start:3280 stop:4032 length:753 start_codon:yes stop_codon:yes gene_type:complete
MLRKIDNTIKYGKQHGGFGIQILYPGLIMPELNDTGFSTIGRIDQARITPGTLIPMHPHKDDEIFTYLRRGKVKHKDSEGHMDTISNQKLMMMNAGSSFYHEEKTLEEDGTLEGLQIFIRPEVKGLKPQVQFHQLPEAYSLNQWRKIAGKDNDYPLQIRSNTWILDMQLQQGEESFLPELSIEDTSFLFYVFNGDIQVNADVQLRTGESALIENENPTFIAIETTDIVLFITQTNAKHFDGGMYSGNLHK